MANVNMFILTTPAIRGTNRFFYAFNYTLDFLEVTISGSSDQTTSLARKVESKHPIMVKNANITTRENTRYVRLEAKHSKVNNISF